MGQIPDLIIKLRQKAKESTQREVAKAIAISDTQLTRLLRGTRQPGSKTLAGIVQAYPDLLPYVSLFLAEKSPVGNEPSLIQNEERR